MREPFDAERLWQRTRRMTALLLTIWLLASLLLPWFARDLDGIRVLGFSLGYWLVAQGALLLYVVLILVFALRMDHLEEAYLRDAEEQEHERGAGAP